METKQVNNQQPIVGMNLSSDPMAIQQGEASFVLNGFIRNGYYRTTKGNRETVKYPSGFYHVGSCLVDNNTQVICLANPTTGDSEIGLFTAANTYTTVIRDKKLKFNVGKTVSVKFRKNTRNELIIYFTDGTDTGMRYLNLNKIPLLNGELDTDRISIFQQYKIPIPKIEAVTEDGALPAATYFVCLEYADANGNPVTSASLPVGPIPIIKDAINSSLEYLNGNTSNEATNKAISIELTNIDESYLFVNVLLIKYAEGAFTSFLVATIPSGTNKYLITGTGNIPTDRDLLDILKPPTIYDTAKTVDVSNDTILWGNLTSSVNDNLQPYFNKVRVNFLIDKRPATDINTNHANPINSVYRMPFRYGEVYALGIVCNYLNGAKSQVFHLPGRALNKDSAGNLITRNLSQYGTPVIPGQWDSMDVTNSPDNDTNKYPEPRQRYEMYNTAFITEINEPNDLIGIKEQGEMGVYISQDKYPNNPSVWGELAGTNIRHHMMPDNSIIPLFEPLTDSNTNTQIRLNYLGITLLNIEEVFNSIPLEIRKNIQSWDLVVSDRTNQQSVIASGLLYNTFYKEWELKNNSYQANTVKDIRLYPNYPFNDLRPDVYIRRDIGQSPNDQYRQDVFTFVTADTTFKRKSLNPYSLRIQGEYYGYTNQRFSFVSPFPKLKFGGDPDDVAIQSTGVGYYLNRKLPKYGDAFRYLNEMIYVPHNSQVNTGNIGIPLHNLSRESTVLLQVSEAISNTTNPDHSRALPASAYPTPFEVVGSAGKPGNFVAERTLFRRPISSYYVTVYRRLVNQYGSIYNVKYRTTNYGSHNIKNKSLILAGDTYIGPYTQKRQLTHFQGAQNYITLPDNSEPDLKYTETIIDTRYHYPNGNRIPTMTDSTKTNYGMVPVINAGIVLFYTESDYNLYFRLNGQQLHETFFQNLQNGALSLEEYLGIKYVDKDNYTAINEDYLIQNTLYTYDNGSPFFDPATEKNINFSGRVIYSLPASEENEFDNWTVYLPLNYYDFPKNEGALIDMRYIGQYRTLFRLENGLFMDTLYSQLETEATKLSLGSGKMFEKRPVKLMTTDNNSAGTNAQFAFNNTMFGSMFVDDNLGIVYHFTDSLNPVSIQKGGSWFRDNLPLTLPKIISNADLLDASSKDGVGYISSYDSDYDLWYLTKRDYDIVNPNHKGRYSFKNGQYYFDSLPVSLQDPKYFINKSFTISYSPSRKEWINFQSFIPNFYFSIRNTVYSGLNVSDNVQPWAHDANTFLSYYGKQAGFVIDMVLQNQGLNSFFDLWFSFITKAMKNYDNGVRSELINVTFNKAIIYNSFECSGLLKFVVQDENDLSNYFDVYEPIDNAINVPLRKVNSSFTFNDINNIANSTNGQDGFFTTAWDKLQNEYFIDKVLDNTLLDYRRNYQELAPIRELYTRVRLIFDNRTDIELALYLLTNLTKLSNP